MSRRLFILTLFTLVCLSAALLPQQRLQSATLLPRNQTVPTRTPTSPPPTEPSPGDGSPGNTPVPTNTPVTPTATQPLVTQAATIQGAFVATALPCGGQPTVQALNTTFVRSGPGTDYEVVGRLVYLEVRPIVGRAADSPWWLIEMPTGQRGWVADTVVSVQGYIAIVPIAVSPPIVGPDATPVSPTAGTPWNPTPLPTCTVTPTTTPSPTTEVSPTQTVSATPTVTVQAVTPTATPSLAATSSTATPTSEAQVIGEAASVDGTPLPTVAPLNVEATPSTTNLLPIAAIVLIAAAVAVVVVRRRGRQT